MSEVTPQQLSAAAKAGYMVGLSSDPRPRKAPYESTEEKQEFDRGFEKGRAERPKSHHKIEEGETE